MCIRDRGHATKRRGTHGARKGPQTHAGARNTTQGARRGTQGHAGARRGCLLYTSDAADEMQW
eukprot:12137671-Karenia_brevis.AAC.1